ncbi:MAG TPA: YihY/virulence factor BrkB family protein [Gaiellaceae bacterium]|nr:YihY/virulence factor BrkB family protein [Gaiellaceae bacterium]
MSPPARKGRSEGRAHGGMRVLARRIGKHQILTYASAIAFQLLIALVALVLFGLALLGTLGRETVWTEQLAPFVQERFTGVTYLAIDSTVERIFSHDTLFLLGFALALAVWEVSGAVRAAMGGLNKIYESEEVRPVWLRFAISLGLAVSTTVCIVGAGLLATIGRHTHSVPGPVAVGGSWIFAIVLLGSATWLLLRFAPAAPSSSRWVSTGSLLVIVAWVLASIGFRYYVTSVASYRSAIGNLAAVLTLTSYLYVSAIIFLTGAELDELARQEADDGEPSPFDLGAFFGRRKQRRAPRGRRSASGSKAAKPS